MPTLLQHSMIKCTHCGEECTSESIFLETGEKFCCSGCKVVFELLRDNNLCNYYAYDSNAGVSLRFKNGSKRFEYLDNPEISQILKIGRAHI